MGGRLPDPAHPRADAPKAQGSKPPAGRRLYTWSWRAALNGDPAGVTLVRISLGRPKWVAPSTAVIPSGRAVRPGGDEFERRYRERLDGFGVERVERRFREVADSYSGRPLVLLCFEKSLGDCHRSSFARCWQERSGEVVPEDGWIR
jgi:hypothetical protein